MTCYLYHICKDAEQGDLSVGYVGISVEPGARIDKHFSGLGSLVVSRAQDKYGELVCSVITQGSTPEMLRLEEHLRPTERIGWNIAKGGGMPPNLSGKKWTKEQADKIPKANRGMNSYKWKGWWVVDEARYESSALAAKATGVTKRTVMNRCKSNKFPSWVFKEVDNTRKYKDVTFRNEDR